MVTWDKKDFGTKRLDVQKRFHSNSEFACFVNNNPKPDFMLEYTETDKCEVIQLYYVAKDSVFIFKQCKPNQLQCVNLSESRPLTKVELNTWETLQKRTVKIKRSLNEP
ncbi:MAG: hypothetical protein K2X48_03310 [Chitinophagaceae bacterium]|nr:hypothetical protein [Chitinophagaceae bacterium]